jgi:hypothetical protein
MAKILNMLKDKVLVPPKLSYEFTFRLIKNGGVSEEKKIIQKAYSENEALTEAVKTAKTKFINAIEFQYTGKFRIIN